MRLLNRGPLLMILSTTAVTFIFSCNDDPNRMNGPVLEGPGSASSTLVRKMNFEVKTYLTSSEEPMDVAAISSNVAQDPEPLRGTIEMSGDVGRIEFTSESSKEAHRRNAPSQVTVGPDGIFFSRSNVPIDGRFKEQFAKFTEIRRAAHVTAERIRISTADRPRTEWKELGEEEVLERLRENGRTAVSRGNGVYEVTSTLRSSRTGSDNIVMKSLFDAKAGTIVRAEIYRGGKKSTEHVTVLNPNGKRTVFTKSYKGTSLRENRHVITSRTLDK